MQRNAFAHVIINMENAAISVILNNAVRLNRTRKVGKTVVQANLLKVPAKNPDMEGGEETHRASVMYAK